MKVFKTIGGALLLLTTIGAPCSFSNANAEISIDDKLTRVKNLFELRPIDTKPLIETERFKLGRALFFDKILSGSHDVACATCHLVAYGVSDGRSISLGVRGAGLGPERHYVQAQLEIHPRNSQDLWNRDHNDASSMFWDGRVEMIDPAARKFRTPLGEGLPNGLDNAMAAQALFPLITPNEMLGYPGDNYSGFTNELAGLVDPNTLEGADKAFDKIIQRLIGDKDSDASDNQQLIYRDMFLKAFPELSSEEVSIVQVANALAHFEELAFATRKSRWDSYLAGDNQSLTAREKRGALLFFGKGRCVACHNGETFSDFQFHSVGVIDEDWRIESEKRDLGRFAATKNPKDAFIFRTPPLRNVTKTAPYFHNGSEHSLKAVLLQHLTPTANVNKYHSSGRFLMTAQQVRAISPILSAGIDLSNVEIDLIIEFLSSLDTELEDSDLAIIVPDVVPSGLPVEYR